MHYSDPQQITQDYTGEKPVSSAFMSVLLHGIIVMSLFKLLQPSQMPDVGIPSFMAVPVNFVMVQKPEAAPKQKEIKKSPPKTAPSELKIQRKFEPASMESVAEKSSDSDVMTQVTGEKAEQVAVVKNASVNGSRVAPVYPSRALRLQQEGTVILHILVDQAGNTGEIKIVESSGFPLLDTAAVEAVSKWSFNPSVAGGKIIKSWVEVPVSFSINS